MMHSHTATHSSSAPGSAASDLLALAIGTSVLSAQPREAERPDAASASSPIGRVVAGNVTLQGFEAQDRPVSRVTLWACDSQAIGSTRGVIRWTQPAVEPLCLTIDVRYISLRRNEAWITGPAVDSLGDGQTQRWLLVRVVDGGAGAADRFWSRWIDDEREALAAVEAMELPGHELSVVSGNLTVDDHPVEVALRPISRDPQSP